MRQDVLWILTLAVAFLGFAPESFAQSDECLVEFGDSRGALPDMGTLCQTAIGRVCVFNLQLCLNQPQQGCTPADFKQKKFRASGHCGPVGKLRVTPSGTSSACGAFAGITVRTKNKGKRQGQCRIRAAVRSAKTHARRDVDKITLVCMPPSDQCPSATTTTTRSSATTTSQPPTPTTVLPTTTTTLPGCGHTAPMCNGSCPGGRTCRMRAHGCRCR